MYVLKKSLRRMSRNNWDNKTYIQVHIGNLLHIIIFKCKLIFISYIKQNLKYIILYLKMKILLFDIVFFAALINNANAEDNNIDAQWM